MEQVHVRNTLIDIYRAGQLPLTIPDQSQPWIVNASLDYFGRTPDGAGLRYTLADMKNNTIRSGEMNNVNTTDSTVTGEVMIEDGTVDLWWPSGTGEQNLYYITIELVSASNSTLSCITKRVGFRTIVLNEYPISEAQLAQGIAPGNNWHFEINGHEFYAKGSNFIPPDAFWPRVTRERINTLFDSVIEGNQSKSWTMLYCIRHLANCFVCKTCSASGVVAPTARTSCTILLTAKAFCAYHK